MDTERGIPIQRVTRRLRAAVAAPEFVTDVLQIAKCTVAATLAWWLSKGVLDSQLPFLAPWTALMTVHATIHRSLSRGVQMLVASALGVALSFVIGHYLGVSLWTFALAMLVGMIGSRLAWLRDEGVAIATTAVFVLAAGFGSQAPLLDERMLEVALGVLVGVVVNLLIVPPLRHLQAEAYVRAIHRRMGEVLLNIAHELDTAWDTSRADTWLAETVALDGELDRAWETVRFARESERMNPRLNRRTRPMLLSLRKHDDASATRTADSEAALGSVGEGISHLRNLTRTVLEATYAESHWDAEFRTRWLGIVRDAGHAIADPTAQIGSLQDRLDDLAEFASREGVSGAHWPIYGSLITSMRHIAIVVVDAQALHSLPVRQPEGE